jgi:DNA helicase-4
VGDDWQAINAFAGSDLKYFKDFDKYFHPAKQPLVIPNNYRSHKDVVDLGNKIMKDIGGDPAKHTKSFSGVGVYKADLSRFVPTRIEKKRHGGGDYFTPAVLRLVDRIIRDDKQDVVLLSRTNDVPYIRKKIGAFETHIRGFIFPKSMRGSIKVRTTHSFKGNEADNVIIFDATEARYPFIHPNWVFNQIFGDTLEKIYYEEQRLFYVAVTRAKKRLFIFTEEGSETPFLNDTNIRPINWENSPPIKFGNKLLVKILNKDKSKSESTTLIKEKLKAGGYDWVPAGVSSWQKIIDDRNSFLISNLQKESWCEGAKGIEVNINDEDESVLAKYFVDEGKWETEFDNILTAS